MLAEISAEGWGLIIAAVGTVIVQIINAWRTNSLNAKMDTNTKETIATREIAESTKTTSEETRTSVNGHTEKLIEAKKAEAYALGQEHGRKEAALAIITAKEEEAKRKKQEEPKP